MKKKALFAAVMGITMCAGTGFAAPATNYDAGAVTVEAGMSIAPDMQINGFSGDDKTRPYAGATVGLGSDFALQYQYADNKASNVGMRMQEFNLNYKAGKNTYIYAGNLNVKGTSAASGISDNRVQVGVKYVAPAGDKTNWWVGGAVGDDLWRAEIGGSYALAPNVDWDLSYQYTDVKNVDDVADVKTRGLYTGLTFKL